MQENLENTVLLHETNFKKVYIKDYYMVTDTDRLSCNLIG